ncbi:MAG: glycosyl hydrolase family 18 protein [Lachnospiraceae bacterium]|nr:glycosyl hydrolase family 18 protein [Lachnospiraceae bacterium]
MRKKWKALLCAGVMFLSLTACGNPVEGREVEQMPEEQAKPHTASDTGDGTELSVWPIYWDQNHVLEEMNLLQNKINNVCYFAAYFDADKKPFIPEESLETFAAAKTQFGNTGWKSYLTFVNDLLLPEGGSSQKDTDLLYTLLQDPTARKAHINEILQMVSDQGFDGIEIDYEAIRKDMNLWGIFNQFIMELNTEAQNRGIAVRVLFEPSVPIDQLDLPEGPEYVLMCYNLYGYGTEPGPKANRDFLIQMTQLLEKMPSPRNMALSIGGFDFAADGTVKQVTESECVALQQQYGAAAIRDEQSNDLVFSYKAQDGIDHEVWYADNETLTYWMSVGKTYGINRFSIWRLGSTITLQ